VKSSVRLSDKFVEILWERLAIMFGVSFGDR
jgi:hypothetical protein